MLESCWSFCLAFIIMMMSLHLGSGPLSLTSCVCCHGKQVKEGSLPSQLISVGLHRICGSLLVVSVFVVFTISV